MRHLFSWRIFLIALICFALSPHAHAETAGPETIDSIRVVKSDAQILSLDVSFPAPQLTASKISNASYTKISLGVESASTGTPGQPELPFVSRLVAVPLGAQVNFRLSGETWQTMATSQPIAPAASVDLNESPAQKTPSTPTRVVKQDDVVYKTDAWLPEKTVLVGKRAKIRDQEVVSLDIFPVRYNPAQGKISWLANAHLEIEFVGGAQPTTARSDPFFEPSLEASILNYDAARAWRTAPTAPTLPAFSPATDDIRIVVRENGLYQITYNDLVGLVSGNLTTFPLNHFVLYNKGNPIARYVIDNNANGFLNPGDKILFYGQALDNTYYTLDNIYWLRVNNAGLGQDMTTRAAQPAGATIAPYFLTTVRTKQENWRWSQHMQPWQAWWWDQFFVTAPSTDRTYAFTLPHVANVAQTATVSVRLGGRYSWPEYNPEHHNRVFLNGSPTAFIDSFWDGRILKDFSGSVAQTSLISGTNQIRVESIVSDVGRPADAQVDWTYFKWVDATYYRNYAATGQTLFFSKEVAGTWRFALQGFSSAAVHVLDITNPAAPVRLLNGQFSGNTFTVQGNVTSDQRFLAMADAATRVPVGLTRYTAAPINLRDAARRADYVVISHANFMSAIQPLLTYRSTQGLTTLLVDINWIYDQFNAGILDPEAIKTFTSYAYASWTAPAPSYVLLVGGSNFNPHGYNPSNYGPVQPVYVPTIDLPVDPFQGESAADNYFVAISGNDELPDMFIGRFPVSSASVVTGIVNKLINYEINLERGAWQNDALFVADNTDSAGDFESFSNSVMNDYLATGWDLQRVFYNPAASGSPTVYYTTLEDARSAIRSRWNAGVPVANYVGHAFIDYWGSSTSDQFWQNSDISTLTNGLRLPFLISLDCLDGYFDYPNRPSLAETFLSQANGGVVAHFATSGLGIATGHDWLHRGFYDAIVNKHLYQTGQVVLNAKQNLYYGLGFYLDLIQTFGLIGDPATRLAPLCHTTDLNCDNQVNVNDIQAVASRWLSTTGQANFGKRWDITGDGQISVRDISRVAADFGWHP